MIVYSKIFDSYTDFFLIQYLRQNKWLWDFKLFFPHISLRQHLVLFKSLLSKKNRDKLAFVQLEDTDHHRLLYYRPSTLAKINFSFKRDENFIYWTVFFDEVARGPLCYEKFTSKNIIILLIKQFLFLET